jgi:succinoglycan biosynthesis protein ExoO
MFRQGRLLMPDETCSVSVIIPVYNSIATLQRAVDSVLRQSLRSSELLIVDDGSQDGSLALAHQLAASDRRVRVIALPENRGKSHAMNTAIAEARGVWIAVLDADDWYEPDRLATLIAKAQLHDVPLIADNQWFHDAAANRMVRAALPVGQGDRQLTKRSFIAGSNPYAEFDYGMLKPLVRADFIRRTKLAYRENARLSEDFLYLVEFFAAGGVGLLVSRPLYNWTQAFGSLSRQWTGTGAGSWRYDFRSALAANTEVLHVLRERDERALADLLLARARAFRRLHHLTRVLRLRAGGAPLPRILQVIACHPSIWPLLTRGLLRRMSPRRDATRNGIDGIEQPAPQG